ncbi:hypothetical protein [Motiliproteus sp. MSK22-1]|uniref:hypothetical protein n=1 Tax=Motiliproteus sp. MSK22-1 TaxID=1897630 RepID=UPI000975C965|nr:hypothetical protein [Motiliproteus sp. MSK22-1]OMH39524.1 hypothetical protein BGP75_02735 [Motiliproteus sp. MSK22-1]
MTAGGIAVAHYDSASGNDLNQCQWIADVDLNRPEQLKQRIDEWKLTGCETSFVLSPKDYQLILVEAPSVEASELKEAIRWRVKDLVSYDITAAVIDYFPLPEDAYRGRSNMIYAVVMPESLGSQIEGFVNTAGLVLDTIDIPELALMNLSELYDADSPLSRACLCLQEPTSYIDLITEKSLYLTRQVDIPSGLLEAGEEQVAELAGGTILDIQRSLDYYESQIGKPPCIKLLICPLQAGETPLLSQFRHNLGVEVEQLDLGELLHCREPLSPEQQFLTVVAVAGALRRKIN